MQFRYEYPVELSGDNYNSIVIRGDSGTGKTSLALELANIHTGKSYFITTRITPIKIEDHFKWINKEKVLFLDASNGISSHQQSSKYEFTFHTIADFVQNVLILAKEENVIIVIDSWNALTNEIDSHKINHWVSTLIKGFQNSNSTIIFVVEGEKSTSVDWLADVIITLKKREVQSSVDLIRPIRELIFNKNRGNPIINDVYLMSLYNSSVHTFKPYQYRFPALIRTADIILDPDKKRISSGSTAFDRFLEGGFKLGSWNIFEVSKLVGYGLDLFIYPIVTNHLLLKRPLINIFREGDSFDNKKAFLSIFTENDEWQKRTVTMERYVPKEAKNRVIFPQTTDEFKKEINLIKDDLKKKFEGPLLLNIGLDSLENVYDVKGVTEILGYIISRAVVEGDIVIGWLNEDQLLKSGTIAPTTYSQIKLINRALVIAGVIPNTGYYSCEPILNKGYVDFDMTPII